ncbi:hydroxyisourate hydrolase [Alphaproteobacteria bacterium]|nr:hydroxyisourate hydrolase [Alphaproteobacteria bacterium]
MAGLTTHVLDTSRGKPAANLKIELYEIQVSKKILIDTFFTNEDGRVDKPLLSSNRVKETTYELLFFAGDYLKKENINLKQNLFLNLIPIRFNITTKLQHYHIPLLLSPFGYSTYRGS